MLTVWGPNFDCYPRRIQHREIAEQNEGNFPACLIEGRISIWDDLIPNSCTTSRYITLYTYMHIIYIYTHYVYSTHTYIHTYIYIYIYVYIYIYIYTHILISLYISIYVYIRIYIYICTHNSKENIPSTALFRQDPQPEAFVSDESTKAGDGSVLCPLKYKLYNN